MLPLKACGSSSHVGDGFFAFSVIGNLYKTNWLNNCFCIVWIESAQSFESHNQSWIC
jgi:hypothetical protein